MATYQSKPLKGKQVVSVELVGKLTIQRRLALASRKTVKEVKEVVASSAFAIQNEAKLLCPVRKLGKVIGGRLRASIQITFFDNGFAASIGTNVSYAAFVEFGTGRRGAATLPASTPLPDGYVHGTVAGMNAQPYLRPAYDRERLYYTRRLRAAFEKGLKG